MTRNEFIEAVQRTGIRPDGFTLDGDRNESYVLLSHRAEWIVYYSERGQRTGIRHFPNEASALDHLLERLIADRSTRI